MENNEVNLEGDSLDYEILADAVRMTSNVDGMICEIGTRLGGSLKYIIDSIIENKSDHRNVISIDPYGNIEYDAGDNRMGIRLDYHNYMRYVGASNIFKYVANKPINLVLMTLEDTEFMKRFSDGVPFYNNFKKIETKYSLVFFDGPHSVNPVMEETKFFAERASDGAVFVYDDLPAYNHKVIEDYLFSHGFNLIAYGGYKNKASYRFNKALNENK